MRSVGQAGGAPTNAGRGACRRERAAGQAGHLRLALFTLLNHGEDGLRPTELETAH